MQVSLAGWSIRGWTIRPHMLVEIHLIDFRASRADADERRLTKLLFSRPTRIAIADLQRNTNDEWIVARVDLQVQAGKNCFCRIDVDGGGSIEIDAQEHKMFLW
jgi:hypothetical protein